MKTILMVGDVQLTSGWKDIIDLEGKGTFNVRLASNVQQALKYLNESHDSDIQLVVEAALPTGEPKDLPKELQGVDVFQLGSAFIRHVRDKGLIPSSSPAYLMNWSEIKHAPEELKGITKDVHMEDMISTIVGIVNPSHHREDKRRMGKEA